MIGVIADDLSGAAELGGVAFRHGLRAEILLDGPLSGAADVVCEDTDSRSCPAGEASARARSAVKLLAVGNPQWIYKKVDSVLRGQVVAEIETLMEELGLKLALLLPANPSLGRVVRDGRYFVHGKAVNETEFARDPEYPRTSANVLEMVGPAARHQLYVCNLREPLPASGIVICEAQSPADLRDWAARLSPEMLAAGAAEFFETLLATKHTVRLSGQIPTEASPSPGAELFVCGSTSESSRAFVRAEQQHGTPVFSLPAELAKGVELSALAAESIASEAVDALRRHQRVILNIGLPLLREQAMARQLALDLVRIAATVLLSGKAGHVYAEGGATAVALARHMGWGRLTVMRELAQGVVTVAVENQRALLFTLKPGSYIWPNAVRQDKV